MYINIHHLFPFLSLVPHKMRLVIQDGTTYSSSNKRKNRILGSAANSQSSSGGDAYIPFWMMFTLGLVENTPYPKVL